MFIGQGPTAGTAPGPEGRFMFKGIGAERGMIGDGLNGTAEADSFLLGKSLASLKFVIIGLSSKCSSPCNGDACSI